jgi:hypothetical protein
MKKFGELVVEKGYASEEEVELALGYNNMTHDILGRTLLEKGFIEFEQFKTLVAFQEAHPEKRIGDCAVELGMATAAQIAQAMAMQTEHKTFLGDMMVELGYITKEQRDEILELQTKTP